jgi:hypothetical protein
MPDRVAQTTDLRTIKPRVDVIADAIQSVCSDGNSDSKRVAWDVVKALAAAGYAVVHESEVP